MYILIEHNGIKESLKVANRIQFICEDDYACTCEQTIGNSQDISIYNDSGKELIKLSTKVTDDEIRYVLNYIIEEDK